MSNSMIEQQRDKRIHVKRLVEYSASDRSSTKDKRQRQSSRVVHDVVGVPIGLIREGSAVLCRDGKAGRIVRVVTHPRRGYPTHIIVRHGRLRPREFRVAFNWVLGIAPDYVKVNLSKRDLLQQPEYRADDEIAAAVKETFHGPHALGEHNDFLAIHATVQDGSVALRGNVRNSARRLEAEQIVSRMRGVIAVENFLFADDEITWKAEWLLGRDPRLHIRNLRLETCLGLVRLHGQIGSVSQRALAMALVKQVPGVLAVNNGLIVEPKLDERANPVQLDPRQAVEEVLV